MPNQPGQTSGQSIEKLTRQISAYRERLSEVEHELILARQNGQTEQPQTLERNSVYRTIRRLRAALAQHRALLKALLDSSGSMVTLKTANKVYQAANQSFCEFAQLSEDQIRGLTDNELFDGSLADLLGRYDERIIQVIRSVTFEEVYRDGPEGRHWDITKTPVMGELGNCIGIVTIIRERAKINGGVERQISRPNISPAREQDPIRPALLSHNDLPQQSRPQEHVLVLNRSGEIQYISPWTRQTLGSGIKKANGSDWDQLALPSNLRHTLKTHIQAVFDSGIGIKKEHDPDNTKDWPASDYSVRPIRATDGKVVAAVCTLSITQSPYGLGPRAPVLPQVAGAGIEVVGHDQPFKHKPLDVPFVIEEAVRLYKDTLPPGKTISLEIPSGLWTTMGIHMEIVSAIDNLLENALEAIRTSGQITVSAENVSVPADRKTSHGAIAEGQYVAICVRDTGVGIDDSRLSKIFLPFITSKLTGSGMGLASVKRTVQEHGGSLHVETTKGKGSEITLYLPAAVVAPPS